MKTQEEIQEQLDAAGQCVDQAAFDDIVYGIPFTKAEGEKCEGYIQALKWVLS